MSPFDRRRFMTGMAAAVGAGPVLLGQDPGTPAKAPVAQAKAGRPDTLFLTWFRDPTTTMVVQWVGPKRDEREAAVKVAVAGPAVKKGEEPKPANWTAAKTTTHPFPLTDLFVHRAELTGLTPGTEYRFAVGSDAAEYRFRTMPAKATDAIHFVSGGDVGVNAHAIANNKLAAKQDPYFAVVGGDHGYDNGRSPLVALWFLKNYSDHMTDTKGRLIPMVVTIGNHEVNGGYGKTRTEAPFYFALYDGLFADASYAALDFGDYLSLILLDTGHISPIEGEQTVWLDKALAARAGRPHLIVDNHVPAYPSYRDPKTDAPGETGTGAMQRKHWCPLFEKHNVDVVLEHHDHTFKRTHPLRDGTPHKDGIVYLGDGSWGMLRVPKTPAQRSYLQTVAEAYHITLHRLEGEQRFHVSLDDTGRVVDVYRTGKKPRHRLPGT